MMPSAAHHWPRIFLSTLPARGATDAVAPVGVPGDISIHAPREGSDPLGLRDCPQRQHFYPRSPRGERPARWPTCTVCGRFLSTLPARGATALPYCGFAILYISIHAPREGSDGFSVALILTRYYFYPRSPRGERPMSGPPSPASTTISIHAPREGSDKARFPGLSDISISIHAPREGSDDACNPRPTNSKDFYPRSPRGERLRAETASCSHASAFLSTLPARGATLPSRCPAPGNSDFYPRSPRGERRHP